MRWIVAAVVALVMVAGELVFSIRQQTQTFDESAHLYAGYSYWKRGDYGVNPEHPPLVKLLAALPLVPMRLPVEPPPDIYFRAASLLGGIQFLYAHDAQFAAAEPAGAVRRSPGSMSFSTLGYLSSYSQVIGRSNTACQQPRRGVLDWE